MVRVIEGEPYIALVRRERQSRAKHQEGEDRPPCFSRAKNTRTEVDTGLEGTRKLSLKDLFDGNQGSHRMEEDGN